MFSKGAMLLKKKYSLKKNEDIQAVLKKGTFFKSKHLIVYIKKNNTDKNYIACLAGKKLGKAPIRNLVKRKIRLAIATYWEQMSKGYNIVIIGRPLVINQKSEIIEKDLEILLKRHKII